MGFFSRLFGGRSKEHARSANIDQLQRFSPAPPPTPREQSAFTSPDLRPLGTPSASLISFDIDWKAELPVSPAAIHDAQLLVTDVIGLSNSALEAVMAKRRSNDTPLIVVSPGLHASALAVARTGGVIPVRATPLPGQPLRDLLEDLAVFAGGCVITKDLGFDSEVPSHSSLNTETSGDVVLPDASWSDISESDLGNVAAFQVGKHGCSFSCTTAPRLADRITHVMRQGTDTDPDGLRARLGRLGRRSADLPLVRSPHRDPDPSAIRVPRGYASPYFVTNIETLQAELERPRVLLSAVPIERLEFMLSVLQHGARHSSPVIVIAPGFGPKVLAAMVVNKLRGTVSSLAIELSGAANGINSILTELAAATGAEILGLSDEALSSERIARVLGTAAKVAAGRSYLEVWANAGRASTL